jgi:hypothetical protein
VARRGVLDVLRRGIKDSGCRFRLERNRFESSYAARFKRSVGLYVAWRP